MTYTVTEAAKYLNEQMTITIPMIRYYLRTRQLKGRWTGTMWLLDKKELDKFIKNSK